MSRKARLHYPFSKSEHTERSLLPSRWCAGRAVGRFRQSRRADDEGLGRYRRRNHQDRLRDDQNQSTGGRAMETAGNTDLSQLIEEVLRNSEPDGIRVRYERWNDALYITLRPHTGPSVSEPLDNGWMVRLDRH